ncbi:MAG TPA: patatin-like phospholipase family protein, partial [Candidatus Dormibacteraeota bacterium]|nr:patatin-like phospholipase family protein [Candidatus Dormibacteraeota bacterium]
VVELGVAQAFVDRRIIPAVIAGASAGGIAAAAHALDPAGGAGVRMGAKLLGGMRNSTVGLDPLSFVERAAIQRAHLKSIGDHAPVKPLIQKALHDELGLDAVTIGDFKPPDRPLLRIVATNRLDGTSVWFPDDVGIEDAILASAAIPGIFPWQTFKVGDDELTLVDGGVVDNQPLSKLALDGCGTIFAVAVGYSGGSAPPPSNLVDNLQQSFYMAMHQSTKLEEEFINARLGGKIAINHLHPKVQTPISGFDFTPDLVAQIMEEARSLTDAWLVKLGY